MRRARILALFLGIVVVAGRLASSPPLENPDQRGLQGTWEIESVERAGVVDPSHIGATLFFTANEVTFSARVIELDGWTFTLISAMTEAARLERMARS